MKKTSFVGKTIERLTVLEEIEPLQYVLKTGPRAGKVSLIRRYRCACACGRETKTRHCDIASRQARSCGCLRHHEMSENPIGRKEKGSSYLRYMFSYYSKNAKDKGITFALSRDEFKALVTAPCYYCGDEPTEPAARRLKHPFYGTIARNGIDRRAPALGYTATNTVPCCKTCNIAKHTMTVEGFLNWIERVHQFTRERLHTSCKARQGHALPQP